MMGKGFIFFVAKLIIATSLFSQDTLIYHKKEWANIGFGLTSNKIINSFKGLNFGVDYNRIFFKNWCYHFGADYSTEFWGAPSIGVLNPGFGIAL